MTNQRVAIFKALADETRLGMVAAIAAKGAAVSGCDVVAHCEKMSSMSQPTLSHHFAKLVDAGVLLEQKEGTSKSYRLNDELLQEVGIDSSKLISGGGIKYGEYSRRDG